MTQHDESYLKLLKVIEASPHVTQRDLAKLSGISLGKVNFCLKALMDKGVLKWSNFVNQENKQVYVYLLTPFGIAEKAKLTALFLKRKMQEFDRLKLEIELLEKEVRVLSNPKVDVTLVDLATRASGLQKGNSTTK